MYLPLENGVALYLNIEVESPFTPKDDMCQVWVKLAQY